MGCKFAIRQLRSYERITAFLHTSAPPVQSSCITSQKPDCTAVSSSIYIRHCCEGTPSLNLCCAGWIQATTTEGHNSVAWSNKDAVVTIRRLLSTQSVLNYSVQSITSHSLWRSQALKKIYSLNNGNPPCIGLTALKTLSEIIHCARRSNLWNNFCFLLIQNNCREKVTNQERKCKYELAHCSDYVISGPLCSPETGLFMLCSKPEILKEQFTPKLSFSAIGCFYLFYHLQVALEKLYKINDLM